jgi:hypothetical protein
LFKNHNILFIIFDLYVYSKNRRYSIYIKEVTGGVAHGSLTKQKGRMQKRGKN